MFWRAAVEGLNSQYKKLMRVSNGLGNFSRFRARLMLCSTKDFAFSPPKKGTSPRKRVGKKRGKYEKRKGGRVKPPPIFFSRFS